MFTLVKCDKTLCHGEFHQKTELIGRIAPIENGVDNSNFYQRIDAKPSKIIYVMRKNQAIGKIIWVDDQSISWGED